ncbi:MAG: hypothetical protein ACP5KN_15390, partial [Armatimonadota bacterium]
MRASWLALTAAVTVSLVASAQPAGQPTPPEAGEPPGLASTQGFTETFETQPLQGWELNPGVQVQQVGQGHGLVFGQAGVAWAPTGAQDF